MFSFRISSSIWLTFYLCGILNFSVLRFLIFLLRCNPHSIKFIPLKCRIQCILIYSKVIQSSPISNIFITLKANLILINSHSSSPPTPKSLATANLSVFIQLLILDVSYKWNHTVCGICFWLLSHYFFTRLPCYSIYQFFIIFMAKYYSILWTFQIIFICSR